TAGVLGIAQACKIAQPRLREYGVAIPSWIVFAHQLFGACRLRQIFRVNIAFNTVKLIASTFECGDSCWICSVCSVAVCRNCTTDGGRCWSPVATFPTQAVK